VTTLFLAFALVTLHRPDGHPIAINPHHVSSLTPAHDHVEFVPGVHCIVHLSDRKFVSVREGCAEAQYQLNEGVR
jgi:hypothetical protein